MFETVHVRGILHGLGNVFTCALTILVYWCASTHSFASCMSIHGVGAALELLGLLLVGGNGGRIAVVPITAWPTVSACLVSSAFLR